MRFNRLRLSNIGAFYGDYDFNLNTDSRYNRNVILFGGKNGSGKTTILDAIRLALFGPLSYGYKTGTAGYYDKIEAKLNRYASKLNAGHARYQIILDIEMVENLKKHTYTIRRRWTRHKKTLLEELQVRRDNTILNDRETEIFQTKLREDTPPQLLEFCLFDGERISQIISDETLSSYLQETAKVVFNLDLFENMEHDLNNFIKQDSIYGSLTNEEKNLHEVSTLQKDLLDKSESIQRNIQTLQLELNDKRSLLSESNRQFEVLGGLVKEKRDELLEHMSTIEKDRVLMMERTKEFVSTILPFVLVKGLVKETVDQLHKESVSEIRSNVQTLVTPVEIQSLFETIASKNQIKLQTSAEEVAQDFYRNFLGLLSVDSLVEPIHKASYQQRAEIETLMDDLRKFPVKNIKRNFNKNTKMLDDIKLIRKQIDESDGSGDLKNLIASIHQLGKEIESRESELVQRTIELEETLQAIEKSARDYETLKHKVLQAKKAENVFAITNRVLEVSRAFRSMQLRKKLHHVELETTRMLKYLNRKELFITRVQIDPITFDLRIFNVENEEIKKNTLSSGEQQILLLSTVWAMVMCSKRRLPFVFDTLLGRLDQTHKKSIIKELVSRCGEQVIILSTDSEIDADLYLDVSPFVSHSYTIDYDTEKSTVSQKNTYFDFTAQGV